MSIPRLTAGLSPGLYNKSQRTVPVQFSGYRPFSKKTGSAISVLALGALIGLGGCNSTPSSPVKVPAHINLTGETTESLTETYKKMDLPELRKTIDRLTLQLGRDVTSLVRHYTELVRGRSDVRPDTQQIFIAMSQGLEDNLKKIEQFDYENGLTPEQHDQVETFVIWAESRHEFIQSELSIGENHAFFEALSEQVREPEHPLAKLAQKTGLTHQALRLASGIYYFKAHPQFDEPSVPQQHPPIKGARGV